MATNGLRVALFAEIRGLVPKFVQPACHSLPFIPTRVFVIPGPQGGHRGESLRSKGIWHDAKCRGQDGCGQGRQRSEEHTSELQSRPHLVCRLLLEKKKTPTRASTPRPQRRRIS